jgi:hypothetical protein
MSDYYLKITEVNEMVWIIFIAALSLFLVSCFWYIWVRYALQNQRAINLANVVEPKEAIARAERYKIDRWLRIDYNRTIYINQIFYLDVLIGPKDATFTLSTLSQKEKGILKEVENEWLQFEALEETPLIQVELKFAEGDFNAGKIKEKKILKKDEITKFRFVLKPLKAEECILTLVISYISDEPVPEQIVEIVTIDKTILPGNEEEHAKQVKMIPASTTNKMTDIKTLELVVSINSLFGKNTRELELIQKALGLVFGLILIGIALLTDRLEEVDAIWFTLIGIANMAGIPIISELTTRPEPPEKTDSNTPAAENKS